MEVERVSVPEALLRMQDAVKRGALQDAALHGMQCDRPLSLTASLVALGELISTGAESRVYKGTYQSQPVAVKEPIIRTTADLMRFREELKIMARLEHPDITPVMGARALPPNYYLVMPLENGSYYDALYGDGHRPEWREVVEVGLQLSGAMQHVHERGILHRDLKTRNVLRGKDGRAKLIDFGIAKSAETEVATRSHPSGGFHKRHLVGTLEYMAPEVLKKEGHSCASDVYAFAVTLNEIATCVYPFSDCTKENPDAHTVLEMGYGRQELAAAVVAEGLRPSTPQHSPEIFTRLMHACWSLDPSSRPTFEDIHHQFLQMGYSFDAQQIQLPIPNDHTNNFIRLFQSRNKPSAEAAVSLKNCLLGNGEWVNNMSGSKCSVDITCGIFATSGLRGEDKMEDRHIVVSPFLDDASSLLGVFDGHRGMEASQFAAESFEDVFRNCLRFSDSAEDAFVATFKQIESRFEGTPNVAVQDPRGNRYPGCTALTTLILKNKLFIANAGDCRAVLCRNGQACQLSRDHTAVDVLERSRIQKRGSAAVEWKKGSWRVGDAGIQVTRSLGDVDLKESGVIADPEVTEFDLTDSDAFVILATDGLWDTVTNDDAVRLVHDTVKQPDMCAKRLATEAVARGSQDNITVIVAFLKPVSTLERIFVDGRLKYSKPSSVSRCKSLRVAADEISEVL